MKLSDVKLQPFNKDTDIPNHSDMQRLPDYFREQKGLSGKWTEMSPDEYIKKCRDGFQHVNDKYQNDKRKMKPYLSRDLKVAKQYAKNMLDGDKFPAPYITFKDDGEFHGQEGLHRAIAAKMIGIKKMPVFIETRHKD